MALKNVPFRSEVLTWDPDTLADYFKKVSLAFFLAVGPAASLVGGLKMESWGTREVKYMAGGL